MAPVAILLLLCSALSMAATDPQELLDIRRWIINQDANRSGTLAPPEKIGKVISCIGQCKVYRGNAYHAPRWLSHLEEGDEVHTGPNSYLWMQLIDGTLVRIAPEGEMALLEINFSAKRVFVEARIARGQVYWLPRSANSLVPTEAAETDRLFLPVMDMGANLETFRRKEYQKLDEFEKTTLIDSAISAGQAAQYQELNRLILANNSDRGDIDHEAMLVLPNGTLHVTNQATHVFHVAGGATFFKFDPRADTEVGEPKLVASQKIYRRGYVETEEESITTGFWWRIAPDGRAINHDTGELTQLSASELLVRRLPTLMLVRERELAAHASFWKAFASKEGLSSSSGHEMWKTPLLDGYIEYLRDHTRRLETTHLRSVMRLVGEPKHGYDERYFSHALDAYFNFLKRRHSHAQTSVLDMSPLHYYGWMLINARQNR